MSKRRHKVPYYLRSKKRKVDQPPGDDDYDPELPSTSGTCYKRKNPIMHLPTEVLQRIFTYMSYKELSDSVRLVNRKFRILCENILNRSFTMFASILDRLKSNTLQILETLSQNDEEIGRLAKILNTIESLQFYHSVIMATIWRYVYMDEKMSSGCMYGGYILDLFRSTINIHILNTTKIDGLPTQIGELISYTKVFCVYFDRFTEEPINNSPFTSGAKIIDILDTALFCKKRVVSERLNGSTYIANINYYFNNSWFVALEIPSKKKIHWRQHQRFMYMRLRRLMFGHMEMHLAQHQYERELNLQFNPSEITKPWNSVYTGYGEVEGIFFFYGVMNDGAYMHKFNINALNLNDQVFVDVEGSDDSTNTSDQLYTIPYLGVTIKTEIQCPIKLAPYAFLHSEKGKNMLPTYFLRKCRSSECFVLKMDIECPGASYARLPTQHCFMINQTRICRSLSA